MGRVGIAVVLAGLLAGTTVAHAAGDPEAGKKVFAKCGVCHAIEAGKNKIGPSVWGGIGHPVGKAEGFKYSDALLAFAAANPKWTPELLDKWLTNPKELIPGTKMIFVGLAKQEDRDNVIAYIDTLK